MNALDSIKMDKYLENMSLLFDQCFEEIIWKTAGDVRKRTTFEGWQEYVGMMIDRCWETYVRQN